MTRGMPLGPQVRVMSKCPPDLALARLASKTSRYSGVSGACWPVPNGFAGSHSRTGLPGLHWPSQLGYLLTSSDLTTSREAQSTAPTPAMPTRIRYNIVVLSRLHDE